MNNNGPSLLEQSEQLYERSITPVEREHLGEYVAVAEDGRLVFAASLTELMDRAVKVLGQGTFGFKVGERAVGHIR